MKGGVGKTTLAVNLSYALAKVLRKKVLLIDIDPQFNATQYLVPQEEYVAYINKKSNKTVLNIFDNPCSAVYIPLTLRASKIFICSSDNCVSF
jgi:chromosome partitioning protein